MIFLGTWGTSWGHPWGHRKDIAGENAGETAGENAGEAERSTRWEWMYAGGVGRDAGL